MERDVSTGERALGPVRDPLADYVMSPEERATPRLNSAYTEAPKTEPAERQRVASSPYPIFDREPPTPPQPDPAVWPPPVYDQAAPPSVDPWQTYTPYRSPLLTARIVIGLYVLQIFLGLITIAASLMGVPTTAIAEMGIVRDIAIYIATIALLVWVYRAYSNLSAFHAGDLKSSPVMAVVLWLIPIVNWFIPWRVMNEIWRASDPQCPIDPRRPTAWKTSESSPLVTFWWLSTFLPIIVIALVAVNNFVMSPMYFIGMAVTSIVTDVFAILLVNAATARQDEKGATLYP